MFLCAFCFVAFIVFLSGLLFVVQICKLKNVSMAHFLMCLVDKVFNFNYDFENHMETHLTAANGVFIFKIFCM